MSKTRRVYFGRLICRFIGLILTVLVCIYNPSEFDVLSGLNFFEGFSVLHILWVFWMIDMLAQLFPVDAFISIGSHKQFKKKYVGTHAEVKKERLAALVKKSNIGALKVFVLWTIVVCTIGALHLRGAIESRMMIIISVFFYVCDLICVLIWCPFRLMMGNRCCTTCRIFNWDHIMMFGNLGFVEGFYAKSLFVMSVIVFAVWEIAFFRHPERFFDATNINLRCANCTDKLCTQYCGKRRVL